MNRRTDLKIALMRVDWHTKDLSDKTGICYLRLIKVLNGYQNFTPEEESLILKALKDRQVEVVNK
jgi:predicted transcriptional regulator